MSKPKFKIGDKVQLRANASVKGYKHRYGFSGVKGMTYEVAAIEKTYGEDGYYYSYRIKWENWCKEEWLELATIVYLGGE